MKTKNYLPVLACICILCLKAQDVQEKTDYGALAIEASKSWVGISYVDDRMVGHKLDVFLPKIGEGPFPVVATIYGSAWFSNNSKGDCFKDGFGQALLSNGFAVVSINHRSSKEAQWPAQLQDVKAAIRFIRGNAEAFGLDTSFLGITGYSSGGHLSAMAGTTNTIKEQMAEDLSINLEGSLGDYTEFSSAVHAVVDWFGPTDFLLMDECGSSFSHDEATSPESTLIGGPIQDHKKETALANPLMYINDKTPPFLIFHGNKDPFVPHCQSEVLHAELKKQGVSSELIIVDEGGHGPGVMIAPYYVKMIDFLKKIQTN